MEFLNFNSVELLPNAKASAAFMVDSGKVFCEDICTMLSVLQGFGILLVLIAYKSRKFVEFGKFVFF